MFRIPNSLASVKISVEAIITSLGGFLEPVTALLPDKRLREVATQAVAGLCTGTSPLVTHIARSIVGEDASVWAMSKRIYRFLDNERFDYDTLRSGVYRLAQSVVAAHNPESLCVVLDPVKFEKPYTHRLPGVCTVHKSTPPDRQGNARLTWGYPAMTATVVNLPEPVVTYFHWYSYLTEDFLGDNVLIREAIGQTRRLFPERRICFVTDSELDDQKIFSWITQSGSEYIIRAQHNRRIEVYNERLDRWESELLDDLTGSVPLPVTIKACFTHARRQRVVELKIGWLTLRLPETKEPLWALVIQDPDRQNPIVLLTNRPIRTQEDAKQVYEDWSHRPQIEHTYRFHQEQGLDVERVQVRTLERIQRLYALTLLAALFLYHIQATWPKAALTWLRQLGGKLGLAQDRDGMYLLLNGVHAVLVTAATIAFASTHAFPQLNGTYG